MLCGVVGAPRATLDVPVPFVSSPFLLCYFPCVLWFLRCLFGLWWSYPFPFPLSLIVVWCMCILCLGSGLLVWRVCQRPREARESPPPPCWCREVGVCGVRHGPVVLAKVLATPLVLCLGSVVCSVVLSFHCACFRSLSLSCDVSLVFFPDHLPFLLPLVSLVCSAQWGGAGHL